MDVYHSCSSLKEGVAAQLRVADGAERREEILIEALYEFSRSILPLLGAPRKSREYMDKQAAVLDLISCIAIPLIRGAEDREAVAVLSEIAEGCQDPLVKKKLLVYARELLARSGKASAPESSGARRVGLAIASCAALLSILYLGSAISGPTSHEEIRTASAAPEGAPAPSGAHFFAATPTLPMVAPSMRERGDESARKSEMPAPEPRWGPVQGEQITRVRVVNNQVLVPVILRNGGEAVKLELVLDTGASRTAIHEYVAAKLQVDLRSAKISQAELADGRLISSRMAKIDAVMVGPYSMTAADLEVIPYKGSDGLHDGLLGMDFLAKHRYQLDIEREVIRWF